jgi:hypothetical protein
VFIESGAAQEALLPLVICIACMCMLHQVAAHIAYDPCCTNLYMVYLLHVAMGGKASRGGPGFNEGLKWLWFDVYGAVAIAIGV